MAIERERDGHHLQCDYCSTHEGPFDSFMDAINHKKANGWKNIKEGEEWYDKCPFCAVPKSTTKTSATARKVTVDFRRSRR